MIICIFSPLFHGTEKMGIFDLNVIIHMAMFQHLPVEFDCWILLDLAKGHGKRQLWMPGGRNGKESEGNLGVTELLLLHCCTDSHHGGAGAPREGETDTERREMSD